ncbi:MAG: glycosyltransferase [Endomicrobium sp.]|jgi:GT2 family glycosyltransferase|nr:glycosyltransferase [Endomicrobium sp.]
MNIFNTIKKKSTTVYPEFILDPSKIFSNDKINNIKKEIDIIIPIYNCFEYLEGLFNSILTNTDLPYKLFVVDDKSSDIRVKNLLKKYKDIFRNSMILYENKQNLGFIGTVNFALSQTTKDVVILNTDVLLPKNWASRLLNPIFTNEQVASVTPISNSATLLSLPKIWCDNNININDCSKIDSMLSQFCIEGNPLCNLPTGVGFCMAMSRCAIDKIGYFDPIFGRGYGEENDWCMRALNHSFINTFVWNMFVFHKHGASFNSEEKKLLIKKNSEILVSKHKEYFKLVSDTVNSNIFLSIRFLIELFYYNSISLSSNIFFQENSKKIKKVSDNILQIIIEHQNNDFCKVNFCFGDYKNYIFVHTENLFSFLSIFNKFSFNKIYFGYRYFN